MLCVFCGEFQEYGPEHPEGRAVICCCDRIECKLLNATPQPPYYSYAMREKAMIAAASANPRVRLMYELFKDVV
jgi:hypothetical protein